MYRGRQANFGRHASPSSGSRAGDCRRAIRTAKRSAQIRWSSFLSAASMSDANPVTLPPNHCPAALEAMRGPLKGGRIVVTVGGCDTPQL